MGKNHAAHSRKSFNLDHKPIDAVRDMSKHALTDRKGRNVIEKERARIEKEGKLLIFITDIIHFVSHHP